MIVNCERIDKPMKCVAFELPLNCCLETSNEKLSFNDFSKLISTGEAKKLNSDSYIN